MTDNRYPPDCIECRGSGKYVSPMTGRESPCSLCATIMPGPSPVELIESDDVESTDLGQWSAGDFDEAGRCYMPELDEDEARALAALANLLDLDRASVEGATVRSGGAYGQGYSIEADDSEYSVMTDDEADSAWDDALDSYIDDCMEIPKGFEPYFDREAWKRDARYDGRGHALASYDGNEQEATADGETFYVFQTN